MKHFLMEMDKNYIHAPQIINWFEVFDVDKLHKETHFQVPLRTSLKIKADSEVQFTDIISHPCLAVSELVHDLLLKFEPNMIFKEIMLFDTKNQNAALYYVPVLDEVECLTEKCVYNLDHSELKEIEIDEQKVRDKSIFQLAGVKKRYTIIRLDLAEALLRRNITGMDLKEIRVAESE